ncbi:MAG: hypothetical protein KAI83_18480 [Thiomargarita sp.]|nr:hypothetical protein [Thiomargarita sp.]
MSIQYKRTNWVRLGRLLPAWLLAGFISSLAFAVPVTTNYQGYLENTDGEPLDATVNMTFALYDTAQGGNALWTETHQQVEVTHGVFSLILGSTTPFDDNSLDGERYLGVTVDTDPEMAPRQPLTSAFFAMRAGVADSVKAASVETESIADDAVTTEKIVSQAITGDKIADLSGHNVTELDDVENAGSGKIISDAEREKLESLTPGGGSATFEYLNVEKELKVGENTLYLTGDAQGGKIWTTGSLSNDDPNIDINDTNNPPQVSLNRLVLQSNGGNVGIGTNNPQAKLHVNGGIALTGHIDGKRPDGTLGIHANGWSQHGSGIELSGNDHPSRPGRLALIAGHGGGDGAIIFANYDGSTWIHNMIVKNNGNVGIGTTNPGASLEVHQDTSNEYALRLFHTQDGGGNGILIESNGGDNDDTMLKIRGDLNGSPKDLFIIKGTGKVGIGTTSPSAKLHVAGGLRAKKGDTGQINQSNVGYAFEEDGDTGMFAVGGSAAGSSDLILKKDNQTKFRIMSNGDVCIGNC